MLHNLVAPKSPLEQVIPRFQNEFPSTGRNHRILRTDAKIVRTHSHPQHRAFRTEMTKRPHQAIGLITIKRHPLDVLLSQLNYASTFGRGEYFINGIPKSVEDIIADSEIDYYIDQFIEAGGWPGYVKRSRSYCSLYADWKNYVPHVPQLHLRYEEVAKDPHGTVRKIGKFLGIKLVDTKEIIRRVEKWTRLDGKFFWRKRAYNHRYLLAERAIERFETAYADGLRDLGYSRQQRGGEVSAKPAADSDQMTLARADSA